MLSPELERRLQALREDNRSGATWLVSETAKAVQAYVQAEAADRLIAAVPALARAVADTQPSMAPLWNLANDLALTAATVPAEQVRRRMDSVCRDYDEGAPRRIAAIAARATAELAPYPWVVTHSMSHTVFSTLLSLHARATLAGVICTEGAPIKEGRALARALPVEGIHVRFTTDAGVFVLLDQCDVVLLGGDALGASGLRNKAGSFGLAAAAHVLGIPVYALCDTTKFIPAGFAAGLADVPRPPVEVWEDAPKGIEVANYYFDVTPLHLLAAIVTEDGVLEPDEARSRLEHLPVAALWGEV